MNLNHNFMTFNYNNLRKLTKFMKLCNKLYVKFVPVNQPNVHSAFKNIPKMAALKMNPIFSLLQKNV